MRIGFKEGDVTLKQEWINVFVAKSKDKEVLKFIKEKSMIEKQSQISQEISYKFSKDITMLFNAFTDILNAEDQGVSKGELLETYGISILNRIKFLEERGVVYKKDNIYFIKSCEYIKHPPETTFQMITGFLQHEEDLWRSKENDGNTKWGCWEIDESKVKEYYEMINKQYQEQITFFKKNSKPVKQGGVRIAGFLGFTAIKKLFFTLCLISFMWSFNNGLIANPGQGGGAGSGGGEVIFMGALNTSIVPTSLSAPSPQTDKTNKSSSKDISTTFQIILTKLLESISV